MNLAQLIDPEWAQQGFPVRFEPVRPAGALPPMGKVARNANELKIDDLPPAPRPRSSRPPRVPTARQREAHRTTPENPWPRGKSGSRYGALKVIGNYKGAPLGLRDWWERVRALEAWKYLTHAEMCNTANLLRRQGYVARTGTPKLFRYAITAAGRAALEMPG